MQDGMKLLREAGMRLVIEGVTSLEEVQRVFMAAESQQPPPVVAASRRGA